MTTEQAKQYQPLFAALVEGRTIQFNPDPNNHPENWGHDPSPNFEDWEPENFRLKPESREWNLSLEEDGQIACIATIRGSWPSYVPTRGTVIKVREVLTDAPAKEGA